MHARRPNFRRRINVKYWYAAIVPASLILGSAWAGAKEKGPPPAVTDANLLSWVDAQVAERMPSAEERRFDEIGWAKDIRDALRLAKEHNRPVFLFTHDGRMNLGRC
jgi:hypothetical protein